MVHPDVVLQPPDVGSSPRSALGAVPPCDLSLKVGGLETFYLKTKKYSVG